jgi:hypothetical protein
MIHLILIEHVMRNVRPPCVKLIACESLRTDLNNFVVYIAPSNVVHQQTQVALNHEHFLHDAIAPDILRISDVEQVGRPECFCVDVPVAEPLVEFLLASLIEQLGVAGI